MNEERHGNHSSDGRANALQVASTLTSLVPWIGGAVSNVLSGMAVERKVKRVQEALDGMAEDLRDLHSDVSKNYVRTDAFEDLLEQTLRRIADEGSAEKRAAYRSMLVELIRDPCEDQDNPRCVLRLIEELENDHCRVLRALVQAPGQAFEGTSPLATLMGRLPDCDFAKVKTLVEDLTNLRLTTIGARDMVVMTGSGSPDLRPYLTPLGAQVARCVGPSTGSDSLARGAGADNSRRDANESDDEWKQLEGQRISLEPLFGMPGETPDPWFVVEEVTQRDVKFLKLSNDQHIRLPRHALSPPWGTAAEGGVRASIESGRLAFDRTTRRWRWRAR